jgi:hypothetical protein
MGSSHLLRAIFVLLVMLLSFNSWASSQDIVSEIEWVEIVDSLELEETDEKEEYDLLVQSDDDCSNFITGLTESDTNQGNPIYRTPPRSFDYSTIPLPPPEC